MRLLVDTHIALWWMSGDPRLSDAAAHRIRDGETRLAWSIVSSWEIAVKISIGKLELDRPLDHFYTELFDQQGLELLGVDHEHCVQFATLPLFHRDPFDRMLVAQAQSEGMPIMTVDPKISLYDVETTS